MDFYSSSKGRVDPSFSSFSEHSHSRSLDFPSSPVFLGEPHHLMRRPHSHLLCLLIKRKTDFKHFVNGCCRVSVFGSLCVRACVRMSVAEHKQQTSKHAAFPLPQQYCNKCINLYGYIRVSIGVFYFLFLICEMP